MKRSWMWIAIAVGVFVIGANVLLAMTSAQGGVVTGPAGSARVTTEWGLAAWRSLLEHDGHSTRVIGADQSGLDDVATLVVVNQPHVGGKFEYPFVVSTEDDSVDADPLDAFIRNGGNLVWFGAPPTTPSGIPWWAEGVEWSPTGDDPITDDSTQPVFAPFETVEELSVPGAVYSINPTSSVMVTTTPRVFSDDEEELVVRRSLDDEDGSGTVTLVADASLVSNARLSSADNALLSLGLVEGGSVAFQESQFGLVNSEPTGWDAVPEGWIAAGIGLLVVAVMGTASAGRALGEPDGHDRPLPPSRALYVDALAAQIAPRIRGHSPPPPDDHAELPIPPTDHMKESSWN